MGIFQSNADNTSIFNEKISLTDLRKVDAISVVGLYTSEILLFLGILLIFLNNLNVIAPGSYFGAYNWVTVTVFSIGLFINFVSIPFLYFSSLKNFIKESFFWDKEIFWILPLFFFGTFFLYNSLIEAALFLLILSIIMIVIIHVKFIFKAREINAKNPKELYADRGQYVMTLKYLSVYYILLLALLIFCDPLKQMFIWIRMSF